MANTFVSSPTDNPNSGRDGRAPAKGVIATLIEAAQRQESLLDALALAVDSGDESAILQAARELAANRRKDSPIPDRKPGRKSRKNATLIQSGTSDPTGTFRRPPRSATEK